MSDYRGSTTPPETRDMSQTPVWLFNALNREFDFALDAAALPETALCEKYLTPDIDSLAVEWGDFISPSKRAPWVWLNPPYSDIGPWVEKAIDQQGKGIGTVMLVPQDTSARWYPAGRFTECRHITGAIDRGGRWQSGRVNFVNKSTGEVMNGNPKGSMLLIFAPCWPGSSQIREVSKLALMVKPERGDAA